MRVSKSKLVIAAAMALTGSLLLAAPASAEQVSYTVGDSTGGIPKTLTDFGVGTPQGPCQILFPQFDPTGGKVLTKVTLALAATMYTTIYYTSSTSSFSAETTLNLWVHDAGNLLTLDGRTTDKLMNPTIQLAKKVWPSGPTPTDAEGRYTIEANTGLLTQSGSMSSQAYTNPAVLAEFTGTGSRGLAVDTSTATTMTFYSGNGGGRQVTDAQLGGTVTYEYSYAAVPEATTMLLGGMAMMPMLMQRRRERSAETLGC